MEEHYTSGAYWQTHADADSTFKADLLLSTIKKSGLSITPQMSGVEVGCGTGSFLAAWYARTGMQALAGTDIAANAIEIARQLYADLPLDFSVASAAQLPGRTDHIYVMDVVEHVEDPYAFLRHLHGQSDLLFLHLPIEQSLSHLLAKKPTKSLEMYQHLHFYSWETAQLLVTQCGYEIVGYQFTAAAPLSINLPGSKVAKLFRQLRLYSYKINETVSTTLFGGPVMLILKSV